MKRSLTYGAVAALALAAHAAAEVVGFTVVPPIPGNIGSAALGLSASGQFVVGWTHVPGAGYQPFRWNRTTDPDVQPLGASAGHVLGEAVDISDDGNTVVGNWRYQNPGTSEATHAFRWRQSTGYQFLNPMAGNAYSVAKAASSNGAAVGASVTSDYVTRTAGRWPSGLTSFSPTHTGTLYDVSTSGAHAVGVSTDFGPNPHAVRWTAPIAITDLGTLPGKNASYGYGITRDGTKLFGTSGTWGAPVGSSKAFMWTEPAGMVDLGILPGASRTAISRVNDAGTMGIGWANFDTDSQTGTNIPVIWRQGAGFIRATDFIAGLGLNSGPYTITELTAISADGTVITGYGQMPIPGGFRVDGFVLTIPTPSAASIFVAACALAARRRR